MDVHAFLRPLVGYCEAFAARDHAHRFKLLAVSMTPDAQIWGPKRVFAGYQEISEKIEGFHKNWPECQLVLASGLNTFLNVARLGTAIIGPDGAILASGHAVIELADDGRIHRVIPFWEPLPLLPADWPAHLAPGQNSNASAA